MTQAGFTFSMWSVLHVFKIAPKLPDEPISDKSKVKWGDVPVFLTVTVEHGFEAGGKETLRNIAYMLANKSGSHIWYDTPGGKPQSGIVVSPDGYQPDKDV